jgi:hypothetical protein
MTKLIAGHWPGAICRAGRRRNTAQPPQRFYLRLEKKKSTLTEGKDVLPTEYTCLEQPSCCIAISLYQGKPNSSHTVPTAAMHSVTKLNRQ